MQNDIKRVLYSEETIQAKVAELGDRLAKDYADKNPIVVCILKGASIFMTDLVKKMPIELEMDFMVVSSYGSGTTTSGVVQILKDLDISIENRHLIIAEDIIDTGTTLRHLLEVFDTRSPLSIEICTLLLKEKTIQEQLPVSVKYVGLRVPDEFVVGYGLDYNEKYRNLPYIGVLKEEIYE